jgi:hypothetical protein
MGRSSRLPAAALNLGFELSARVSSATIFVVCWREAVRNRADADYLPLVELLVALNSRAISERRRGQSAAHVDQFVERRTDEDANSHTIAKETASQLCELAPGRALAAERASSTAKVVEEVVPSPGFEPGTHGFSVRCSTN